MYSNISQILLLYKMGGYYNKFDSMKSIGIYYLCVKMPKCRYMEHGLKHITFDVQKLLAPLPMCYNPPLDGNNIFKCIFFNENVWISLKISMKFVRKVCINNIPALVQVMAWHRPGDKPVSEPMMISLLMHICVTRPQWVKWFTLI